ncbi:MAG: rRNA maturation RNase YbeY [Candidatus Limivivens sp.]|nr:rRNA maturation RNase YbeY [Candidatus Limivivens sp.]
MTVIFEDEYGKEWPFSPEELAGQVIGACLDFEECPYEAQVSLLLTGGPQIHEMNRDFRGIDRETDVLSFPMQEYPKPGDFSLMEEDPDSFDPDSGELLLGDIVLNGDRVFAQAEEYGHSVKREFAFLIAHSMLHLMGYDHMEEAEAKLMESRQKEILELLNIKR